MTLSLVFLFNTKANAITVAPNQSDCSIKKVRAMASVLKCAENGEIRYVGFSFVENSKKVVVYWQDIRDVKAKFTCNYTVGKDKKVSVRCNPNW